MKIKSMFSLKKWIIYFLAKPYARWLSDTNFLKAKFYARIGRKLDLNNPTTFNEKLQWLKLYDRKPEYTMMVDKYLVREYIKEKIGEEYLVPLVGVWDNPDEVDFDALPNKFALKCNHNSSVGTFICKNKAKMKTDIVKKELKKGFKQQYFWVGREWPYKNVVPRVIVEEFVKDGDNENLPVYKFFCFNGKPKIIQTIQNDKQPNESIDYFDTEWNLLDFRQNYPNSERPFVKPKKLKEMLRIAATLSQGYSFIRVDLYIVNDAIKFSEFTFYSDCGFAKFEPEKWDYILGSWIELPTDIDKTQGT